MLKLLNNLLTKTPRTFKHNIKQLSNIGLSEEVKHGLETKSPIVALESTIITHGMPYPDNVKCALEVERVIRQQGAIPATIGILRGKIKVGLDSEEINFLAETNKVKAIKTSRRDLAYVVSQKLSGGTTVAGTIIIANRVGIPIFVTGGIGGVHRDGEKTLDISADLTELGRNPVAVVSSGVKSILDIPKTLEYLETQGVFVATIGDTKHFPAFYSQRSGSFSPYKIESVKCAAEVIHENLSLGLNSGMLFAVPIPETDSFDDTVIEEIIQQALKEAAIKNISGKEITPFLLSFIGKITDGKSLQSNIALVKNNARVGAGIAVELSALRNKKLANIEQKNTGPVVIGGCVVDCVAKLKESSINVSDL